VPIMAWAGKRCEVHLWPGIVKQALDWIRFTLVTERDLPRCDSTSITARQATASLAEGLGSAKRVILHHQLYHINSLL